MIPRLHKRTHSPRGPLAEALGRPLSANEGLTEYTVVAHWPGLDYYTHNDEHRQPGAACRDTAHRLELIARRLHMIQQDLDTTAARLVRPQAAAAPAAPRRPAHRST
ncbi:hypothetical protein [Streptomyces sp. NPDC018347]|uniref:hypothetical protein n=1 Tax=Streptomyces sp. NPDC018347 TaxID=3157193 RepID=UPI0033F90E06